MKRKMLLICFSLIYLFGVSQENPILMRINGKAVSRSDFEYSYQHHADTKLSPKDYLETFVQLKLQVEDAKKAGLDTSFSFRQQLNLQRSRIFESHLSQQTIGESLDHSSSTSINRGETGDRVLVMQIFKSLPQTISSRQLEKETAKMDSIYQAMCNQSETSFTHWVHLYSDDKASKWIAPLQATSEMEQVVFSLPKGGISRPFATPEGLHILKVVDRVPRNSDADKPINLFSKKKASGQGVDGIVNQLKTEWGYSPNASGIDELMLKGETKQQLFSVGNQSFDGELFAKFASSYPQSLKRQFNEFVLKSLLDYGIDNIETRYPELRYAMAEWSDNNLMDQVVRQKIDLPSVSDEAGLAIYFKTHRSDYRWSSPRYKGIVVHCSDKATAKQVKKLLKKTPENEWQKTLLQVFEAAHAQKIIIEQGLFASGDNSYIDKRVFKKGDYIPSMSHPFTVMSGKKRAFPDDHHAVIEQVQKDYRNYLYAYWTRELRSSAKIEVNQEILKTVNNN